MIGLDKLVKIPYHIFPFLQLDRLAVRDAITPQIVIEEVADIWRIDKSNILCRSRIWAYCGARQMCCYIFRNKLQMTFHEIGRFFNLHHATVMHSCYTVEREMEVDDNLLQKYRELKMRLYL
jgi:chromosomal replication initiation ATPase DnaA